METDGDWSDVGFLLSLIYYLADGITEHYSYETIYGPHNINTLLVDTAAEAASEAALQQSKLDKRRNRGIM